MSSCAVNAAVVQILRGSPVSLSDLKRETKPPSPPPSENLVGVPVFMEDDSVLDKHTAEYHSGRFVIKHYDTPAYTHAVTGQRIEANRRFTVEVEVSSVVSNATTKAIMDLLTQQGLEERLRRFTDPSTLRVYVEEPDWEYVPVVLECFLVGAAQALVGYRAGIARMAPY